jgi:hypothetical protein
MIIAIIMIIITMRTVLQSVGKSQQKQHQHQQQQQQSEKMAWFFPTDATTTHKLTRKYLWETPTSERQSLIGRGLYETKDLDLETLLSSSKTFYSLCIIYYICIIYFM